MSIIITLEDARVNANMTQEDMESLFWIPVQQIIDWENHKEICPKQIKEKLLHDLNIIILDIDLFDFMQII